VIKDRSYAILVCMFMLFKTFMFCSMTHLRCVLPVCKVFAMVHTLNSFFKVYCQLHMTCFMLITFQQPGSSEASELAASHVPDGSPPTCTFTANREVKRFLLIHSQLLSCINLLS
jgi:hypothetical protein